MEEDPVYDELVFHELVDDELVFDELVDDELVCDDRPVRMWPNAITASCR